MTKERATEKCDFNGLEYRMRVSARNACVSSAISISNDESIHAFNRFSRVAIFFLLFLNTKTFAQQTEMITEPVNRPWGASLIQEMPSPNGSSGFITWNDSDFNVRNQWINFAYLSGQLNVPVRELDLDGRPVKVQSDGSFDISFGFLGRKKTFVLTMYDEMGRRRSATYSIVENPAGLIKPSRFHYYLGMGVTNIRYSQSFIDDFVENELTLNGGVSFAITPGKLDFGISSFFNVYTLGSTGQDTIQFLGVNLRFGYHLKPADYPTQVNINGGLYYNTTFSQIGFRNMIGPQLYPELSHTFKNGQTIFGYAKYSPVASGARFDAFGSREFATGVHYAFPVKKRRYVVGVDFSKLDVSVDDQTSSTKTLSASLGVSF